MTGGTFWIVFALLLIVAFGIGAIPFAYIFTKQLKGIDIRKVGSGNVGATNAARVLGRPIGFLILLLDMCKGVGPVFLGSLLINRPYPAYPWALTEPKHQLIAFAIGIAAFLGHCFNPFLMWGAKKLAPTGKGVATGLGVFLMLAPYAALLTFAVCIILIVTTRLVSLASIAGAALLPIFIVLFAVVQGHQTPWWDRIPWVIVGLTALLCVFVILRHRANIKRLLAGTESKA